MYVCLHTNIFTCIQHICMTAFIHICICTDSWMCEHALIHTCAYLSSYIYTYICPYTQWESCKPNAHIHTGTHVCLQGCFHTYIQTHMFQPRKIHNFRAKYFHSFQICIFPVLPDSQNFILLEIWRSDNSGNTEVLQIW